MTSAWTDERRPQRTWASPREHPSMWSVKTGSLVLSAWPMSSPLGHTRNVQDGIGKLGKELERAIGGERDAKRKPEALFDTQTRDPRLWAWRRLCLRCHPLCLIVTVQQAVSVGALDDRHASMVV